jgi:hypothetical protein
VHVRALVRRVLPPLVALFAFDWLVVDLWFAILISVGLLLLTTSFCVLVATATPEELWAALERLGLPPRVAEPRGEGSRGFQPPERGGVPRVSCLARLVPGDRRRAAVPIQGLKPPATLMPRLRHGRRRLRRRWAKHGLRPPRRKHGLRTPAPRERHCGVRQPCLS